MASRSAIFYALCPGVCRFGQISAILLSLVLRPYVLVSQEPESSSHAVSTEGPAEFWVSDDAPVFEVHPDPKEPIGHDEFVRPRGYGVSRAVGFPHKPRREKPGDRNWSDCPPGRYEQCRHCRAGWPQDIARWAKPSVNGHYAGGYVGGGSAILGRRRTAEEGTWGLDYRGHWSPRRVFLAWTCGREQGGEGAYQTDGMTCEID